MQIGLRRFAVAGAMTLGAGLLLAPSATAAESIPQGCPPDVWYKVVSSGASYEAIGSTAGKYNASPTSAILRYDLTTSKSKQTTWSAELGGSLDFGVGQVESKTKYDITKSTTRGKTVSNTINVPAKRYGYTTPKIERRKFTIEKWQDTARCGARFLGNVGTPGGITAYPFFSECTAKSACTPKP
ncbi:hypothetical protein [Streptomyces sp. MUM 16J]|uniref:hypothetical protein n=1 Tax=Streptomyces sp. MUM 16J TaxID=2791988 RepID=UPI001F047C36|nr:hypothetical protein [Streptomyces sp. MUM 16J]MCH0561524.1 hypothetical protein [Streptomyces sp. MUM 16J]